MAIIKTNLTYGTTGNLPAVNASAVTALNASNIASGTLATARYVQGGGKLLQIQSVNFTSGVTSVTSDSFTATEVTDQITPSATSSKIVIMINLSCSQYENSGTHNKYKAGIYRSINGGTYARVYAGQSNSYGGMGGFGSGTEISSSWPTSLIFTDSPSTTSAVDYKLYLGLNVASAGGNNVTTGASDMERAITLMEIGA